MVNLAGIPSDMVVNGYYSYGSTNFISLAANRGADPRNGYYPVNMNTCVLASSPQLASPSGIASLNAAYTSSGVFMPSNTGIIFYKYPPKG